MIHDFRIKHLVGKRFDEAPVPRLRKSADLRQHFASPKPERVLRDYLTEIGNSRRIVTLGEKQRTQQPRDLFRGTASA